MTAARRHSTFYRVYMRSPLWHLRRWWWWTLSDGRCQDCRRPMALHRSEYGPSVLTVHHLNYRRLGHERRSDVRLICWNCHQYRDAWRHL